MTDTERLDALERHLQVNKSFGCEVNPTTVPLHGGRVEFYPESDILLGIPEYGSGENLRQAIDDAMAQGLLLNNQPNKEIK